MKHPFLLPILSLAMLTACNSTPTDKKEPEVQVKKEKRKANIIKKPLNIPYEFSYITNMGSVDIIYTQGDYHIDIEGDSAMLQHVDANFDSSLLTVSIRTDKNNEVNLFGTTSNVRMYVSCPELHCVSVCGNGDFESAETWKGNDIRLGMLGTGALKLGKIECKTLTLESSNIGNVTIGDLQAQEATIYSRSSANIDVNLNVEELTVLNEGKQTITLNGTAKKTLIKNPKDERLTNNLK